MRDTRVHGLGDYAYRYPLKPWQNVALEIHAIERPVIAPGQDDFALLRG
jgi:hypothetical protein